MCRSRLWGFSSQMRSGRRAMWDPPRRSCQCHKLIFLVVASIYIYNVFIRRIGPYTRSRWWIGDALVTSYFRVTSHPFSPTSSCIRFLPWQYLQRNGGRVVVTGLWDPLIETKLNVPGWDAFDSLRHGKIVWSVPEQAERLECEVLQ